MEEEISRGDPSSERDESPGPAASKRVGPALGAHRRLGGILQGLWHRLEAEPENGQAWIALADALRLVDAVDPEAWAAFREVLRQCLLRGEIDHQHLAGATVALLSGHPVLGPAIGLVPGSLPEEAPTVPGLQTAGVADAGTGPAPPREFPPLDEPILVLALSRMVLPDYPVERFLTGIRRRILETLTGSDPDPSGSLPPTLFLIALAQQCFLTGYVYVVTERESQRLGELENRLAQEGGYRDTPISTLAAVLAMYRPLSEWPVLHRFGEEVILAEDPGVESLWKQQVRDPAREAKLKDIIPRRGSVTEGVSQRVRMQYEESPYPRWISVDQREPRPVREVLAGLFPRMDLETLEGFEQPRILVAGCGTGKHLLKVHHRFRGARIHGVDLSLASLAFALRKIREARVPRVTVEQADILTLGSLGDEFDIVESVGVLHHLEDPLAGWRILRGLVRGGGLMKIGVYSKLARRQVAEARAFITRMGFGSTEEEIRRARPELAREFADRGEAGILAGDDFYSLPECRDLLFHVQERTFTLPEIAGAIPELDVDFLGFEIPNPMDMDRFRLEHPGEGTETDLGVWCRFEERHPGTFRGMYQLWLRAH